MPESFSLHPSRWAASGPSLRQEILNHTGSEAETSGIMRSIERFEGDSTILRYEITPKPQGRHHRSAKAVAWTVRAVRPDSREPDSSPWR